MYDAHIPKDLMYTFLKVWCTHSEKCDTHIPKTMIHTIQKYDALTPKSVLHAHLKLWCKNPKTMMHIIIIYNINKNSHMGSSAQDGENEQYLS